MGDLAVKNVNDRTGNEALTLTVTGTVRVSLAKTASGELLIRTSHRISITKMQVWKVEG